MSYDYQYCDGIRLHVEGRVSPEDAARQERTARDLLARLKERPGVILADEVGMGKTFVALAAATSVALGDRQRRPVVVMVPPSLKDKWPRDFGVFRERCLPEDLRKQMNYGRAERAEDFLKLLDDKGERRKSIIFITHGAMSRGLTDRWVMAALIQQAVRGRWGAGAMRGQLSRIMGELLNMKRRGYSEDFWRELMSAPSKAWLDVLREWDVDPEGDGLPETDDDPVPKDVRDVLPELETKWLFQELTHLPRYRTASFSRRVLEARRRIREKLREVWSTCIRRMRLRFPLLVLDEAHHLKNPGTHLASLFQDPDAEGDANEVSRGRLAGVFERMLFLTATPFQLGHNELCSVLDRFGGIAWTGRTAPPMGREGFQTELDALRKALDLSQQSAVTLDAAWGRLTKGDLGCVADDKSPNSDGWWEAAQTAEVLTPMGRQVLSCFRQTNDRMRQAERLLRPWVVRHLKPRHLPPPDDSTLRRIQFVGKAINGDETDPGAGLAVSGDCLVPFLLAARAVLTAPESRPVFAEGLASSYEAFLDTRKSNLSKAKKPKLPTDAEDDSIEPTKVRKETTWYLDQLERFIPRADPSASASHPKVGATVDRAVRIWEAGDKVLVFCHYIITGRILRQHISGKISERIREIGAAKMHCAPADVSSRLENIGKRFFDKKRSPLRQACDAEVGRMLKDWPQLQADANTLIEVARRYIRTPSFLVRYFPLDRPTLDAGAVAEAFAKEVGGRTLRETLRDFFKFLADRCGTGDGSQKDERAEYLQVAEKVQTGSHAGDDVTRSFAVDECQGDHPEALLPNVRLANGTTSPETRRRLMLAFNTPFYPEVLIASSVMAEGVDLHLNCRHVIHHDLCWNPSTLEQRTGRVDRVGAKAEKCGQPIHVYLPYVAETQDEKMYRVVMDRQRWFSVVMGESYKVDVRTTDKLAERVPLPASAAAELAFRLEVATGSS